MNKSFKATFIMTFLLFSTIVQASDIRAPGKAHTPCSGHLRHGRGHTNFHIFVPRGHYPRPPPKTFYTR